MRVKKVSIYIRLCGEPGRPFERLKVRNPGKPLWTDELSPVGRSQLPM
jgi:hypothetical protein